MASAAAICSTGPSPSEPTSRNSISGRKAGDREQFVEPLLDVDPPRIERDRAVGGQAEPRPRLRLGQPRQHPPRIGAVMGDQQLLARHAGAPVAQSGEVRMEDEAEAMAPVRRCRAGPAEARASRRARAGNGRWRRGWVNSGRRRAWPGSANRSGRRPRAPDRGSAWRMPAALGGRTSRSPSAPGAGPAGNRPRRRNRP